MVAVQERKETMSLAIQRGQEVVVKRKNDAGISLRDFYAFEGGPIY